MKKVYLILLSAIICLTLLSSCSGNNITATVDTSVLTDSAKAETDAEEKTEEVTEPDLVSDKTGYWYESGKYERELSISRVGSGTVYFDYVFSPGYGLKNGAANMAGNTADFDMTAEADELFKVSGSLIFGEDYVSIDINYSEKPDYIAVGTVKFDEKHTTSHLKVPETTTAEPETQAPPVIPDGNPVNPYFVTVTVPELYIREGPGTNYNIVGSIYGNTEKQEYYYIIAEYPGQGSASGWGKLSGGEGWIALDYAEYSPIGFGPGGILDDGPGTDNYNVWCPACGQGYFITGIGNDGLDCSVCGCNWIPSCNICHASGAVSIRDVFSGMFVCDTCGAAWLP